MCKASEKMNAINNSIKGFADTLKSQAGEIFGDANAVFNKITHATDAIINGGLGQHGWTQNQKQAVEAQITQATGTEARNTAAAAKSALAAVGGGNTVAPAGLDVDVTTSALNKAAETRATLENQAVQADFVQGNENFWNATKAQETALNAFDASDKANAGVTAAQDESAKSQQNVDNQNNWATGVVTKVAGSALGAWASGGFKLPKGGGSGDTTEG